MPENCSDYSRDFFLQNLHYIFVLYVSTRRHFIIMIHRHTVVRLIFNCERLPRLVSESFYWRVPFSLRRQENVKNVNWWTIQPATSTSKYSGHEGVKRSKLFEYCICSNNRSEQSALQENLKTPLKDPFFGQAKRSGVGGETKKLVELFGKWRTFVHAYLLF